MHEKMQANTSTGASPLIKNGKFFVAPEQTSEDFKELFARLTASGAGRPVDEQGFADGSWTPTSLADAISSIEANRDGIELRAVQMWFQDNDNGISIENMRWLARIFGCDDPEAASLWQAELKAANDRLASKRRAKRAKYGDALVGGIASQDAIAHEGPSVSAIRPPTHSTPVDQGQKIRGLNLALRTEAMFAGPNSLSLPITIWGCLSVLWLLTFSFGVHSVTYSPFEGTDKQVGFIWSIGWNIGDPIFLPLLLMIVSGLLNSWKRSERSLLIAVAKAKGLETWTERVSSFSLSCWAILLVSFGLIFLIQWMGVYLFPLLGKNSDSVTIDWVLVALVRPEVLSAKAAIVLSFLGYLYSGMIYFFFFSGLLLLYAISGDYSEICAARETDDHQTFQHHAVATGMTIMTSVFRCTILGILMALTIKMHAAYLVSDAEGIISWMIHDASAALGLRTDGWTWIKGSPSSFFTSFLLLFLICFVFGACIWPVKSALDQSVRDAREKRHILGMLFRMTSVISVVAAGYLLIGQFYGFSIALALSISISLASLFWKMKPLASETQGA